MANVRKDPTLLHEPGIYLGMSEEEYHADEALGSTDKRALAVEPWAWQRRRLRRSPGYVTEAMKFGSALHCRVLEGKEAFEERYAEKPVAEAYGKPGETVLVTIPDLKAFLKSNGVSPGNRTKPELIAECKQLLHCPIIFEDILNEWSQKPRVKAGYDLTREQVAEIEDAAWYMSQDESLAPVMEVGALTGGAGEVSIFYEEDGLRQKCRFDYAIPPIAGRDYAMLADLKSFANYRGGGNVERAAIDTIYRNLYDYQAVDYLHGFERGRGLAREGKVFGPEPFDGYVKSLFGAEQVWWVWIMVHRDGGLRPSLYWLRNDDEAYARDLHFQNVEDNLKRGLKNLAEYREKFGDDVLWPPPSVVPLRITSAELPNWQR